MIVNNCKAVNAKFGATHIVLAATPSPKAVLSVTNLLSARLYKAVVELLSAQRSRGSTPLAKQKGVDVIMDGLSRVLAGGVEPLQEKNLLARVQGDRCWHLIGSRPRRAAPHWHGGMPTTGTENVLKENCPCSADITLGWPYIQLFDRIACVHEVAWWLWSQSGFGLEELDANRILRAKTFTVRGGNISLMGVPLSAKRIERTATFETWQFMEPPGCDTERTVTLRIEVKPCGRKRQVVRVLPDK